MGKILTIPLSLLIATHALASERVDVCAKYVNTGKTYHVQAINTDGGELNSATSSFNYESWSHYIVIFWAQDQATVIKMDCCYTEPTSWGWTGSDQEARQWE